VHALPAGVEHDQHAPALGEGEVRDDWRRAAPVLAASVDNKSAVLEQADTGARARPASEQDRIAAQIERQSVQAPHRSADGQCELRA